MKLSMCALLNVLFTLIIYPSDNIPVLRYVHIYNKYPNNINTVAVDVYSDRNVIISYYVCDKEKPVEKPVIMKKKLSEETFSNIQVIIKSLTPYAVLKKGYNKYPDLSFSFPTNNNTVLIAPLIFADIGITPEGQLIRDKKINTFLSCSQYLRIMLYNVSALENIAHRAAIIELEAEIANYEAKVDKMKDKNELSDFESLLVELYEQEIALINLKIITIDKTMSENINNLIKRSTAQDTEYKTKPKKLAPEKHIKQ